MTAVSNTTCTKRAKSKHAIRMAKGMSGPYQLSAYDVCCGRGKGFWNHPGNQAFQKTVQANAYKYGETTSKIEKSRLVDTIVQSILGTGARFLRQDTSSGLWFDIGESMARDKTGHAIRDHLLNQKKSKAKAELRRQKKAACRAAVTTSPTSLLSSSSSSSSSVSKRARRPIKVAQSSTRCTTPQGAFDENNSDHSSSTGSSSPTTVTQSLDKSFERMPFNVLKVPTFSLTSDFAADFDQGSHVRNMIDSIIQKDALKNLSKEVKPSDLSEQEVLEVCELLSEDYDDDIRPLPLFNDFGLLHGSGEDDPVNFDVIDNNDFMPVDWMKLKLL